MKTKKISIKGVTQNQHDYFANMVGERGLQNQGEAFKNLIDNDKIFNELGLDNNKFSKMKMIVEMLSKDGNEISLDVLMNRMIETSFSEAVGMSKLSKEKVVSDISIQHAGSARLRVQHFVEMIKEHNSKSEHKLMITQTLLADGLNSGKVKKNIDLSKIKASDKTYFVNGTNANRKAIKSVVLENKGFKEYNSTIGEKSPRSHNKISSKNLSINE